MIDMTVTDLKEILKCFLNSRGLECIDIIDFRPKSTDDEYGSIGEHYCVTGEFKTYDTSNGQCFVDSIRKSCLINRRVFRNWIDCERAVIWIENS